MLAGLATPVFAQVSGGIAIQSDYRLRGYSISNQDPVAVADVSYDHSSGFYANGSVISGGQKDDSRVIGLITNLGYARRLGQRLTLDTGLIQTSRLHHYGVGTSGHYTEGYVGLSSGALSARVSYSPNFLRPDVKTLYSEVNGGVSLPAKLRLDGHVGYLGCLNISPTRRCVERYDWRVGVSRPFNRLELRAAIYGVRSAHGQRLRVGDNPALIVGAAWTF